QGAHMTTHAELREAKGPGYIRAASYLLQLPDDPILLDAVQAEGSIISAVTGSRYADAIYDAVWQYLNGQHDFPYTQANSDMLARERKISPYAVEPFLPAFGHLPHASV